MNAPVRIQSGVERAAVLMMLVGEEEAAAILQKLEPEEVQQLGKAMFSVADVSEDEVSVVLDDFVEKARERTTVGFDPRPHIETVMNKALGQDKAESVLAKITPVETACQIELLDWMDAAEIVSLIKDEHPQIAAVLLANLDPSVAAQVLEGLPEASQPQILHRIAKLGPITPEAIDTLKSMVARRSTGRTSGTGVQLGGAKDAAKILSSGRKATETRVMPKLAKIDRDIARQIEDQLFVFDNLLEMDDKNLGVLIRNVDSDLLVRALKGVDENARNRFLGCMSARAADGIRDEMEARGPMKLAEVLDAQKGVITVARNLAKDGTIMMGGGDDDYV
ncbi:MULTISPECIES: flagellar motor switch protein FliG [Sphingomonas]|uniref:Flagellar motor switch protein FliG n=1 Tax=Sphingomonas hankookensis TaxID=563996 RepID=A0ABR5Y8X4_9SPHN|nr:MULTISPECIES: flagellar motor switch protein FliG [Sphingomonas]KZE08696.1 flagellar motor switch protein FliG [Sphingomonas hankookensis]PZT95734.1 MAG: flagellar motor switch protein FliG [Sphingomonas sp.]RSV32224.1 flagellar motor switch protein FliG [Sphingomonas sp. ABOLH]WCP72972.1 flagellar motor switch protein FliG [Sphingomonas hankookensis]